MKKYSRYVAKAANAGEKIEEVAQTKVQACKWCDWDFQIKHPQEFQRTDGRKSTRMQVRTKIAIPQRDGAPLLLCDVCYCKSLFRMGKAQMSDTVVADLHMQAMGAST